MPLERLQKRHDMRDVKYLEVELKGNVIGDRS